MFGGKEQPPFAFKGLSGQAFHGSDSNIGFVQGNNSCERTGLGFIGRGKNDEVAHSHNLVIEIPSRYEFVVVADVLKLKLNGIGLPALIVLLNSAGKVYLTIPWGGST